MSSIKASKALLRKQVAEKLQQLSLGEKERQSKIVVDKLLNSSAFKSSQRVSVFLSIDNEVNTEPIVRKIFSDGKQCFVPRYSKKGMEMVKLHSMEDWETLPLTPWKIKQPSMKDQRENALETGGLDLIIVPGVAFTKNGGRMGHGGGYYDKFMKHLDDTQDVKPKKIAIAFKEQVLDEIPLEPTDVFIDEVLYTE